MKRFLENQGQSQQEDAHFGCFWVDFKLARVLRIFRNCDTKLLVEIKFTAVNFSRRKESRVYSREKLIDGFKCVGNFNFYAAWWVLEGMSCYFQIYFLYI